MLRINNNVTGEILEFESNNVYFLSDNIKEVYMFNDYGFYLALNNRALVHFGFEYVKYNVMSKPLNGNYFETGFYFEYFKS